MRIKDFYDWLLKKNKQKAEKLKIVCQLSNLDLNLQLAKNTKDLVENKLSFLRQELLEFRLTCKSFVYEEPEEDLKYFYDKKYITKDQYKQHCLNASDRDYFVTSAFTFYNCEIISSEELIEILFDILESSDSKEKLKFQIVFLINYLRNRGNLSDDITDKLDKKNTEFIKVMSLTKTTGNRQ